MVRAEFLLDGYTGKQDEDIRFRSSGEGGSSEGREAKERAARQLGVRLGVEVVFEDASKLSGRKRGAKGWFDPTAWGKDGRRVVHVALDNHADAADVERTILHEAVGHLGLRGDKFTIRYGVIARHLGKDNEHDLPEDVWRQLPEAIQKPFAITRYFADKQRGQQKGYRLYTALQLGNGSHVVVSAEVKNAGRDLEVNAVNTVFGRNALSNVHDELIYVSETITLDQQALLNGNNPRQYPANRELSGGKDSHKPAVSQTSEAEAGKERHPHALPERLTSEPDFHRSGEEGTETPTSEERAMRDALSAKLREAGIEVVEDSEAGQRVLDEVNERGERVRMQAMLGNLTRAANTIRGWLKNGNRGKVFSIELPQRTQRMVREAMGRDFASHNITANGIVHALKNHGEGGNKLNERSIPVRKKDAELIPYMMRN